MKDDTSIALMKLRRDKRGNVTSLAIAIDGDQLPTEFRIFAKGWNSNDNAPVLFDDVAAKAVMAHFEAHGADRMIDLEHLSLDEDSVNYDPDARGWCRLELRNGELWAVGVSWTADGAARLTEKRQRYISPAFPIDKKTRRPHFLLNIAITAMPATHGLEPLVAARATPRDLRKLARGPSFDDVRTAIASALSDRFPQTDPMSCEGPYVVDVFDATFVYQLEGSYWELPYTFDGTAVTLGPLPVEVVRSYAPAKPKPVAASTRRKSLALSGGLNMTPEQIAALAEALGLDATASISDVYRALATAMKEMQDALAGEEGAGDPAPAEPTSLDPAAMAARVEKAAKAVLKLRSAEVVALRDLVFTKTGKKTASEALSVLDAWQKSHTTIEAEQVKLAAQLKATEATERKQLVGDLVTCGAATPAMAWAKGADGVADIAHGPAPIYARMSIVELREHVSAAKATRLDTSGSGGGVKPPVQQGTQVMRTRTAWGIEGDVEITEAEVASCKASGTPLEKYASTKLGIQLRSATARKAG